VFKLGGGGRNVALGRATVRTGLESRDRIPRAGETLEVARVRQDDKRDVLVMRSMRA
jgi:hypothetical protein